MKRKFLLAIGVLVLAVGMSAFTASPKKTTTARWFLFSGTYDLSHLQNAANYGSPTDVQPCSSDGAICAVQYEPDGSDPDRPADFNSTMQQKIADLVNDGTPDAAIAQEQ